MVCPACGTENKPDTAFCMSCGSPLPEAPFSQIKKESRSSEATRVAPAWPSGPVKEDTIPVSQVGAEVAEKSGQERVEVTPGEQQMSREPTLLIPTDTGTVPPPSEGDDNTTAQPPQAAVPKDFVFGVPLAPQGLEREAAAAASALPVETPAEADSPPVSTVVEKIRSPELEKPEPQYYLPPEADYHPAAPEVKPPPLVEPTTHEEPPQREELQQGEEPQLEAAAPSTSQDSTQVIAPIPGQVAAAAPRPGKICPECYAPNPENNMYCQECGGSLSVTAPRQMATSRGPAPPAGQQTAVMPADMLQGALAQPAYAMAEPGRDRVRSEKSLGVADVLAVLSIAAVALALVPAFTWKRGIDMSIFSHQGAFSPGRTDLLGGPGILPYSGLEFFTIGMMAAIGAGLALVFLVLRVGRGPMYILAGSILIFPLAYLFWQAILPLRQAGISAHPALGLRGIFLGNTANPGVGPPLWLITGAGVLLILAGFIAPPRGWGRLFTFILSLSIVVGIAFFCAACYNWNLFISDSDLARQGTGLYLAAHLPTFPILLH